MPGNDPRRGTSNKQQQLRKLTFETFGRVCFGCGDRATQADHIIEIDAGGSNSIDNMQPLCKRCHAVKTSAYNAAKRKHKAFFLSQITPPGGILHSLSPMQRSDPPTTETNGT